MPQDPERTFHRDEGAGEQVHHDFLLILEDSEVVGLDFLDSLESRALGPSLLANVPLPSVELPTLLGGVVDIHLAVFVLLLGSF